MNTHIQAVSLFAFGLTTAATGAFNRATVFVQPSFAGGSGPFTESNMLDGPVSAGGSATGGASSSGSADIQVSYGSMLMNGHALVSLNAISRGEWSDTVTITAPGIPNGTQGTLTFSVRVGGIVNANSGSSAASWNIQAGFGGGPETDLARTGTFRAPELQNPGYSGAQFGVHSATTTFTYGSPIALYVFMQSSAQAANTSQASGQANFGTPLTLDWLGITNVTANGSPVSNFVSISMSGINWGGDLTPQQCDSIDFNNDTSLFDPQDIDAFLSVYSEGPCIPASATCGDIDFNNDGSLFDPCDIDSFLLVFSEGPCTSCGQ